MSRRAVRGEERVEGKGIEGRSASNASQKSGREGKAAVGSGFKESTFCLFRWRNRLNEPVKKGVEDAETVGRS